MKIMILNGPNLNLLGEREPEVYGKLTLSEIQVITENKIDDDEIHLEWIQSNLEGELINAIHRISKENFDGLVINPGGYSHTSVAIFDALKMLKIPIIEVHLSQIYQREEFRHILLTGKAATAIMSGLGKMSYYFAVLGILQARNEYVSNN